MRVHNLPSFLLSCSPRYRPFNTPINKWSYSALHNRLTVQPVRCFTSTLIHRNSAPSSTGAVNDNEINSKVDQKGFPTLSISNVPTTPKLLGFAGLIPFIGSTICAYTSVGPDVIQWQLVQGAYGASILSFMGAIHWGLAMTKYNDPESKYTQSRYLVSVTPSLVAFLSVLTPIDIQLSLQAVSFLGLLGYDLKCWKRGLVPAWYPSLRIWLTMGVVGSQAGMLVL